MRPPAPILSAVELADATNWVPRGHEPIPCVPPPADDREALVRWNLADTARKVGLRGTSRLVLTAATAEEWEDVALDLKGAGGWCRWDDRTEVRAASRAAAFMGDRELGGALWELAEHCGLSVDRWITATRAERAKAGA